VVGAPFDFRQGAGAKAGRERWCTVKYMFLLYANKPLDELDEDEARQLFEAWTSATSEMAGAGVLIDCGPLQPPSAATTVAVRDGETLVTDGPAAEIKEHFGGYTLVDCADLDEALTWAARVPTASDGRVEVRPVVQVVAPTDQPA
jgi:hypothetical protein